MKTPIRIAIGIMLAHSVWVAVQADTPNPSVTASAPINQFKLPNIAHAVAKPLPQVSVQPETQVDALIKSVANPINYGEPGVSYGAAGKNAAAAEVLTESASSPDAIADAAAAQEIATPADLGTSGQPYTTSRTSSQGLIAGRSYPFSAAGKLVFTVPSNPGYIYLCSAALIKPGVIVTAAHCVAEFGANQFYANWAFYPAVDGGKAAYGYTPAHQVFAPTSYLNGTDTCAVSGVVCQDDVAVIVLKSNVGKTHGYFSYAWNGYSFNTNGETQITQLGYPMALDKGVWQERTDSLGYTSTSLSNNTIIGSLQTGGSSGGPWVVNLGIQPVLNGTSFGQAPNPNVIVGVTSWGFNCTGIKQQGASPFTSNNIAPLVNEACSANPKAC